MSLSSEVAKVFPAEGWDIEVLGGSPEVIQGRGRSCLGPVKSCSSGRGIELQKKLKEQGSFAALELYVTKRSKRQDKQGLAGGWYAKSILVDQKGWTTPLA